MRRARFWKGRSGCISLRKGEVIAGMRKEGPGSGKLKGNNNGERRYKGLYSSSKGLIDIYV